MAVKIIKAIRCIQNDKLFYLAVINSRILKTMCVVSRKKENREKGFQRLLNPKRAKEIAKYLDDVRGVIPSAIIVIAVSAIYPSIIAPKSSFTISPALNLVSSPAGEV